MNTHQLPEEEPRESEAIVCACFQRTEAEIRDAIERLELATFEEIAAAVLAGAGCTTCRPEIEAILEPPGATQGSPSAGETSEHAISAGQTHR